MQIRNIKVFQILISINFALFIISLSIVLTLLFVPLYYFDIGYLGIDRLTGISRDTIMENYKYMIQYLFNPLPQSFRLPSLPYSERGQIHFADVKKIFTSIEVLLFVTGIISTAGLYRSMKRGAIDVLKKTYLILLVFILLLFAAFAVNFNAVFILFHQIFFRNNYWLFDPASDPVINILPETFFMHAALFILGLIVLSIILLCIGHRRLLKKKKAVF